MTDKKVISPELQRRKEAAAALADKYCNKGGGEPDLDALAKLNPFEYGAARRAVADRAGVAVRFVDDAVKMHRGMGTPTDLPPDPEPWESEVDGADLLDDLTNATREYLILRKGLAETVALWVVFTHCHNAFEVSPVLAITSPTPECGKTSLLTLLGELAPRPLPAANITGPAFFRAVDAWTPTVLIDEADTFLRDRDELRGILNSGHNRRNAWIVRTQGEEHDPRRSRLGRLRPSL